jgi:hypothetical protein
MKFAIAIPFTRIVITSVDYLLHIQDANRDATYPIAFNDGVRYSRGEEPTNELYKRLKPKME